MRKLIDGIQHFQQDVFSKQRSQFEQLAGGQSPVALFITCSDSRIDPNLLTQTQPGELFVLRNAGNLVPPYDAAPGSSEAATIEYAVKVLKVPNIIVCGHSHCGAMTALLHPENLESLPAVRSCLQTATKPGAAAKGVSQAQDEAAQLTAMIESNVLTQLENLRTHPAVAAALENSALNLHGWVYKFESGQVFAYQSASERFDELQAV